MTSVKAGSHFSHSATLITMRSSDGARNGSRLFYVCKACRLALLNETRSVMLYGN